MSGVLAVGSRKSLLALTQTKIVIEKLKLKNPQIRTNAFTKNMKSVGMQKLQNMGIPLK